MITNSAAGEGEVQLFQKVELLTPASIITVNNIEVQIIRKPIKNLHLGVYPPNGRVRVAAPTHVTDENVRLAVISKLGWIKSSKPISRANLGSHSGKWSLAKVNTCGVNAIC